MHRHSVWIVLLASSTPSTILAAEPIDIGSRRELFVDRALAERIDGNGELTSKPLRFTGRRLSLNYATSAAGNLRIELQDAAGKPLRGFSLADADELYGDSVNQTATWRARSDVSQLAGQVVRLRFVLHDADLFAIQFAN
jgi:hypothetical protein